MGRGVKFEEKRMKSTTEQHTIISDLSIIHPSLQVVCRPYISLRRRKPTKTQRMWSFSGPRERERPRRVLHVCQVLHPFQFFLHVKRRRYAKSTSDKFRVSGTLSNPLAGTVPTSQPEYMDQGEAHRPIRSQ